MWPFGDGIIDSNIPPVDIHAGAPISRFLGVVDMLEVDESESATSSGRAIVNDVQTSERPVTTEDFLEIFFPRIVREVEDAETGGFRRCFAIAFVAFPIRHGRPGSAAAIGRSTPVATSSIAATIAATIARSRA